MSLQICEICRSARNPKLYNTAAGRKWFCATHAPKAIATTSAVLAGKAAPQLPKCDCGKTAVIKWSGAGGDEFLCVECAMSPIAVMAD